MNTNDVIKLNESAIKAWNEHDADKFLSYCSSDITWRDSASAQPFVGIEGAKKYFTLWMTSFPDFNMRIVNTIANTDSVAVELEFTGTNTGALQLGEEPPIPPTNKSVKANGTYFAKIRDGKIYTLNTYPDLVSMMTQLGLQQEHA